MSAPVFIYLAPSVDKPRFKIGLSVAPRARFAAISEPIDVAAAVGLVAASLREARHIERLLHLMFRSDRVIDAVPGRVQLSGSR